MTDAWLNNVACAACFIFVGWVLRSMIYEGYQSPAIIRAMDREIDLRYKWPKIKAATPDINDARTVFAFHVFENPSWTKDYSQDALREIVFNLK